MRAHAKINLALSVGPPAAGGMHPIASWMHAVDLADDVEVQRADAFTFIVDWAPDAPRPTPIDWAPERDLAVRAHAALEAHLERRLNARIDVQKRIPVGAGLGGGSADAACVLLGLNEVLGLGLDQATLATIGAALGSDIPFFVDEIPPRPAIVTGFADKIERLPARDDEVLLIIPHCSCATGAVYGAYDRLGPNPLDESRVRRLAADLDPADLFNDLAAPAAAMEPDVDRIRRAAEAALGSPVHVTGSGSAMFALSPVQDAAALADIDAVVVPTRLI